MGLGQTKSLIEIRDALADKYGSGYENRLIAIADFKAGFDAALATLTQMKVGEFAPRSAEDEANRQHHEMETTPIMKWEFRECFKNGARWQHSQFLKWLKDLK